MFARRFTAPVAATAGTFVTRRFKTEAEDERWLEAEIDEHTKQMTNEERYALQKQKAVLAKMMGKMRTQSNEKVKEVEDKHAEEIAALKARLEQLEKK
mmetsp:Transcript_10680/g.33135  ORF Transcript_10680/g.33135 Transcript_10680/m.33135 type:complete len:98 (-) Transcript_10680:556-849(-)